MPIALAEYFSCMFASVATDVFRFHSTSLGALEGGRETKDLKVACATLVWYHLLFQDQHTTENGVHNQYLSRFDMRAWSPRLFNALQVFYFNMRLSN
jgi:hypothetical protein